MKTGGQARTATKSPGDHNPPARSSAPFSAPLWRLAITSSACGHNAAATLDSVAAYARIVTREVLLGEGSCAKILTDAGPEYLPRAQAAVAADGPGKDLLYRAINGFSLKERRASKEATPDVA
jgi:hypothetical protein